MLNAGSVGLLAPGTGRGQRREGGKRGHAIPPYTSRRRDSYIHRTAVTGARAARAIYTNSHTPNNEPSPDPRRAVETSSGASEV